MPVEIFSKEQFEAALPSGFVYAGCDTEHCYRIPVSDFCDVLVRSSVHQSGVSAECGEDSIRCWLTESGEGLTAKPLAKKLARWTTRITGWQNRLLKLIEEMKQMAAFIHPCPVCNQVMRIVEIKNGKNAGELAVSCSAKTPEGEYANHHFSVITNQQREEIPSCEVCGGSLRKVAIRKGRNVGKEAWTCPAKDNGGNFMNHCFIVID